jgi:hypothetical protein
MSDNFVKYPGPNGANAVIAAQGALLIWTLSGAGVFANAAVKGRPP